MGVPAKDRSFIGQAVTKAKRRNSAMSALVFDFVRDLLLKQPDQAESVQEREERWNYWNGWDDEASGSETAHMRQWCYGSHIAWEEGELWRENQNGRMKD
jgi:hypothetical protein